MSGWQTIDALDSPEIVEIGYASTGKTGLGYKMADGMHSAREDEEGMDNKITHWRRIGGDRMVDLANEILMRIA